MSQAETDAQPSKRPLYLALAGVGGSFLVIVLLGWLILRPTPKRVDKHIDDATRLDSLAQARSALARDTDLDTCRNSLQQINSYLDQNSKVLDDVPPLKADELRKQFGLDKEALNEISSRTFTLLDGQYLDHCLLLRDAAQSFQASGLSVKPTPLQQATTAFAWTMRHVRLTESAAPTVPPVFALRRGSGSALERALIYLALLQQVAPPTQLQGCLISCPAKKDGPPRLWACGVVVDGGADLYLFDPRLGLPLPGPDGQGVATLAAVRKYPKVLAQLTVKDSDRYDVTADQAALAELQQVCQLSALAPRIRALEETLLGPAIGVHLSTNPQEERDRLKKAAGDCRVLAWQEGPDLDGPSLLRRFLPLEEGGSDTRNERLNFFRFNLAPWNDPGTYSEPGWPNSPFARRDQFPPEVGLGQRVRYYFANPFMTAVLDPHHPRNLMLRGRFSKALKGLVEEQTLLGERVKQKQAVENLEQRAGAWLNEMFRLYAEQQRELRAKNTAELARVNRQIDETWSQGQAVHLWLDSLTARPRNAEISYLMALCKHDHAEQLQARLDVETKGGMTVNPADKQQTQSAWKDAWSTWSRYLESYSENAGRPSAQLLSGRCLAMQGRSQDAAAEWANLQGTGFYKIAALYLAQQARKKETPGPNGK